MASPTEEMGDDPGSAPFVLTAIGLVITITGPLLVSNRLWEATRRR